MAASSQHVANTFHRASQDGMREIWPAKAVAARVGAAVDEHKATHVSKGLGLQGADQRFESMRTASVSTAKARAFTL